MNLDILEKIRFALASGKRIAVATVVQTTGSSPQKAGAKMIVFEDGTLQGTVGGGAIEYTILRDAAEAIRQGKPLFRDYNLARDVGMICGGGMSVFIEPMGLQERVVVFGCGHVSRALAPMLVSLGFNVTVVDDRPEWADPEAFPAAVSVVCKDLDKALGEFENPVGGLFVLSVTRGHSYDYRVLRFFVDRDIAYLGVMASRKKAGDFRKALADEGVSEALVEKVHMPVGLAIGSSSPEEIAVSISGELISIRKKVRGRDKRRRF